MDKAQTFTLSDDAGFYLWSADVFELIERLLQEEGAAQKKTEDVFFFLTQLCEGKITPAIFIASLTASLGLPENRVRALAVSLYSTILLKIAESLPFNVREQLAELGVGSEIDSPAAFINADAQDVEEARDRAAAVIKSPPPQDVPAVVKVICDHEAFGFSDPLLNDRCKKIVESRVRDVRDAASTRAQFERPVDKGGLGESGRRLADILERLEATVFSYEEAQRKRHEEEKLKAVQDSLQARAAKALGAKQEETLLDKRFNDLVGTNVDTQKMRTAIEEAKRVIPKSHLIVAPTMQEIAFEKRLTGPVDELRHMTLADFRRLSRDPAEAATKIKDKVELLEEQGYDKKIEGVKAWRSCPVNSLYLSLAREALVSGIGIAATIAQHATKKEESLTTQEYQAILALNGELRF